MHDGDTGSGLGVTVPSARTDADTAELAALRALLRISEAVARADHVDEVLEVVAQQARAALRAASVSIGRWDDGRVALRTLVTVGARVGHGTELAAPVMIGDSRWGEIRATDAGGRRFGAGEADLLQTIAAHTEVAIGRSELLTTVWRYAFEDPLTGIGNRRALERRFAEIHWEQAYPVALLCDLDGLKRINDRDGHPAGDRLLRGVARELDRLSATIAGAVATRLGGDEFCVLLPDATLAAAQVFAMDATRAIRDALGSGATVSWGAAVAGPDVRDGDALLAAADAALMEAKRQGPARFSTAVLTAQVPGRTDRRKRDVDARPAAEVLPAVLVQTLSEKRDFTVVAALEVLATQVQQLAGIAAWSISECTPDGTALVTVRSVDCQRRQDYGLSVITDLGPSWYELVDYPASARAVAEGTTFVAALDMDDADGAEAVLLGRLGYQAVLGVGVLAGPKRYLLEFFSHDGHLGLTRLAPLVEVLAAYCVSRLSETRQSHRRP